MAILTMWNSSMKSLPFGPLSCGRACQAGLKRFDLNSFPWSSHLVRAILLTGTGLKSTQQVLPCCTFTENKGSKKVGFLRIQECIRVAAHCTDYESICFCAETCFRFDFGPFVLFTWPSCYVASAIARNPPKLKQLKKIDIF